MATSNGAVSLDYASANAIFLARDIYPQLVDSQNDTEFMDFMMLGGMGKKVIAPVYSSGVNTQIYAPIPLLGATITGSGARTITVVLTAPNSGTTVVGKTYQFPNGQIGRIMTKTTTAGVDTLTIQNVENANLTVTAADGNMTIAGNAQEEGSLAPDPQRRNIAEIKNQVQIFRNSAERTDIASAQKTKIEIGGKSYIVNGAMLDAYTRQKAEMQIAFIKGKLSDTLFADTNPAMQGARGYGVQTTRGVNEYINLSGVQGSVATTGVYTLADEIAFEGLLEANRSPLKYLVIGGLAPMATAKSYYKGLGSSGMTSARLNVNGHTIDTEVDQVNTSGGFELNFKRLRMFTNAGIFEQDKSKASGIYANSLYFMPMGKTKLVGGGSADYFGYNWMPVEYPGDGTPEMAEVHEGALAKRPVGRIAIEGVTYESIAGFRCLNPAMFGRLKCNF